MKFILKTLILVTLTTLINVNGYSQDDEIQPYLTRYSIFEDLHLKSLSLDHDTVFYKIYYYQNNGNGPTKSSPNDQRIQAELAQMTANGGIYFELIESKVVEITSTAYAGIGTTAYSSSQLVNDNYKDLYTTDWLVIGITDNIIGNVAGYGGEGMTIIESSHIPSSTNFDNILLHEIGHALGLKHTFFGTKYNSFCPSQRGEGRDKDDKDDDGNICEYIDIFRRYYNQQCPELANGTNSGICGDLIPDTPADPHKWFKVNGVWTADPNLKDSNNQSYSPLRYNQMSYFHQIDQSQLFTFTEDQYIAMRSFIGSFFSWQREKQDILPTYVFSGQTYTPNDPYRDLDPGETLYMNCPYSPWEITNNTGLHTINSTTGVLTISYVASSGNDTVTWAYNNTDRDYGCWNKRQYLIVNPPVSIDYESPVVAGSETTFTYNGNPLPYDSYYEWQWRDPSSTNYGSTITGKSIDITPTTGGAGFLKYRSQWPGGSWSPWKTKWITVISEPVPDWTDLDIMITGGDINACEETLLEASYNGGTGFAAGITEYEWALLGQTGWTFYADGFGLPTMVHADLSWSPSFPPSSATVRLRAKNPAGWSDWYEESFSIDDQCGGFFMMMAPNPVDASGETTITLMDETTNEPVSLEEDWDVEVYDANYSSKVKKDKVKGKYKLNTHGWNKGVYMVKGTYKNKQYIGKLKVE